MAGRFEIPDPNPLEVPLFRPLSIHEEIKRFVRSEMSRQAQEQGQESFEEADDFDVGDDDEIQSPYEMVELKEEFPVVQATAEAPGGPVGPTPPAQATPTSLQAAVSPGGSPGEPAKAPAGG